MTMTAERATTGAVPVALTTDWLPVAGEPWLDRLAAWHARQLAIWRRAREALAEASDTDVEGLAEDERLAAEGLAVAVETIVAELTTRWRFHAIAGVVASPKTVEDVRAALGLGPEVARPVGERSLPRDAAPRLTTRAPTAPRMGTGDRRTPDTNNNQEILMTNMTEGV